MKTGVLFPSHAADVTYTAISGGWAAAYPISNAAKLVEPSRIARAAAAGAAQVIGGVFSAARVVRAIALIGHQVPAGAGTLRLYLFSSLGNDPSANAGTMIFDSGDMAVWPGGSGPVDGYRATRPYVLPADMTARSFRLVLSGVAGVTHELAGIEIGGFWQWPGISNGRELGVRAESGRTDYAGGASHVQGRGAPVVARGNIDLLAMKTTQTTGLDFQTAFDRQRPFVWAEDFDDPATWARKCLLVRNEEVPPMVGAMYRHDRFPVRLVEHLR